MNEPIHHMSEWVRSVIVYEFLILHSPIYWMIAPPTVQEVIPALTG